MRAATASTARGRGFAEQHAVEFVPELDRAEMELRSLLSTTARSGRAQALRRGACSPGGRTERARRGGGGRPRRPRTPSAPQGHREEGVRASSGRGVGQGRALLRLMSVLGLDRDDVVPVYVGDDLTDEDAFIVVRDRGLGVVVRGEAADRPRPPATPSRTPRRSGRSSTSCRPPVSPEVAADRGTRRR